MELFKNTNYDFLGLKWPFIIASLVLTLAGFISLAIKGGPRYGIDFKEGAEVRVRFSSEPQLEKIRAAIDAGVGKGSSIQRISDTPEVEIVTETKDQKQLNANRQAIEDTLTKMFGEPAGKLQLNNSSQADLADKLRDPLLQAGVPLAEQQLQDLTKAIEDYRAANSGIIHSIDELSKVPGVTPQVLDALKRECVPGAFTVRSAYLVGPKVGGELRSQAIRATLYALAAMLVYIAFRFEWVYGAAAVVAVFHDTLITIGLFSLLNKEISLTVVAALLTLVGYSMNDTIVVFDRIRENLKIMRREKLENLINISVNQTLSRTVLTSGLTLLTALSLWLFGGEVLNGFALALVLGIIVGTYSSVYIASPILLAGQKFLEWRKAGTRPVSDTGGPKVTPAGPKATPPGPRTSGSTSGSTSGGTSGSKEPTAPRKAVPR